MPRVRIVQFICIAVSIISMIFMGAHLFLGDGISHPSPVLEITAALTLAGLTGNAVCAFIRYAQEKNRRNGQ